MRITARPVALALGVLGIGHFAFHAPEVLAQAAQKIDKIEVTGSNIKRTDVEGPSPIQVITREEIEKSGASTVADFLRNIPANTTGSYDDTFTGSFARGSAGISLRGLGQRNTLVLINSRRMVPYGFAQNLQDSFVDLNSIPPGAIERIEVLKDGASAIYGSDAIGGVVNIILRKDYRGLEATTGYGKTSHGDGAEKRFSVAGGYGDIGAQKFNFVGTFDWFKRDTIWVRDRDFSRTSNLTRFAGGTDLRTTISNPGNYVRVGGAVPGFTTTRLPFPNCPADRITTALPGGRQCFDDLNRYDTLIPSTERYGGYVRGTFDVAGKATLFAELGFNHTESFTQSPPFAVQQRFVPGVNGSSPRVEAITLRLPVGHPNNPYTIPVNLRYRFDDVGPRQIEVETDTTRAVFGGKTSFGNWDVESAFLYAKSETVQRDYNNISVSGLLGVLADGSYNFVNNAANSAAVYDRIRANYARRGKTEMKQLDFKASTELAELPAGPLALALGGEYRKESMNDVADDILASGDVANRGVSKTIGSRNITSLYAELSIPLVKRLELQLAGRYDHYSDFGNSTTPKAAIRWEPTKELVVRASYAKGFRAPNFAENSDASFFAFNTVTDTLRCGKHQDYCGATSVGFIGLANRDLKPEKADSYSVGIVFEPMKELSVSADYYYIRQKDWITQDSTQIIIDRDAAGDPRYAGRVVRDTPTQDDIARGVPGAILSVSAPYQNFSEAKTKGLDIDLKASFSAGEIGKIGITSTTTRLISFKAPLVYGEAPVEQVGVSYIGGSSPYPKFKNSTTISLDSGPWYIGLTANYVHKFRNDEAAVKGGASGDIKAQTVFDLQAAYKGLKNTRFTLGVRNLQDKEPPTAVAEGRIPYINQLYSPRGRFVYGNINYKFL